MLICYVYICRYIHQALNPCKLSIHHRARCQPEILVQIGVPATVAMWIDVPATFAVQISVPAKIAMWKDVPPTFAVQVNVPATFAVQMVVPAKFAIYINMPAKVALQMLRSACFFPINLSQAPMVERVHMQSTYNANHGIRKGLFLILTSVLVCNWFWKGQLCCYFTFNNI